MIQSAKDSQAQELQYKKDRAELFRELNVDEDKIDETVRKIKVEIAKLQANIDHDETRSTLLIGSSRKRFNTFKSVRELTERELRRTLSKFMKANGMNFKNVPMDHDMKKFPLKVAPRATSNYVELTSLSGGEKSKTLVCLIHALWEHQQCPFRGLDEWDVFLDDKSRKHVEEMLVETSKNLNFQFFFISPQNSYYTNRDVMKRNRGIVNVYSFE